MSKQCTIKIKESRPDGYRLEMDIVCDARVLEASIRAARGETRLPKWTAILRGNLWWIKRILALLVSWIWPLPLSCG